MVNNVYDLVTRTMEQEFPGRVAFRWVEDATGTVKEKTYAEYAQDIRRAAAWFARNIPEVEGKRVVLLSRNCYEYGVNTFGAVLAGAVLVTMNQKKTWATSVSRPTCSSEFSSQVTVRMFSTLATR